MVDFLDFGLVIYDFFLLIIVVIFEVVIEVFFSTRGREGTSVKLSFINEIRFVEHD